MPRDNWGKGEGRGRWEWKVKAKGREKEGKPGSDRRGRLPHEGEGACRSIQLAYALIAVSRLVLWVVDRPNNVLLAGTGCLWLVRGF